jgi:hypothetical protein
MAPQPQEGGSGRGPPIKTGAAAAAGGGERHRGPRTLRPRSPDGRWTAFIWGAALGLGLGTYLLLHQPGGLVGAIIGTLLAIRLSRSSFGPGPDEGKVILSALVGGLTGQLLLGSWLQVGTSSTLERVIGAPLGAAAALGGISATYVGLALWRVSRARHRYRRDLSR